MICYINKILNLIFSRLHRFLVLALLANAQLVEYLSRHCHFLAQFLNLARFVLECLGLDVGLLLVVEARRQGYVSPVPSTFARLVRLVDVLTLG